MRALVQKLVKHSDIDSVVSCAIHTTHLASLCAFSLRNEKLADEIHEMGHKMIEAYAPTHQPGVAKAMGLLINNNMVDSVDPSHSVPALLGSLCINLEYCLASVTRLGIDEAIPKRIEDLLVEVRSAIPLLVLEKIDATASETLEEVVKKHGLGET